MNKIELYVTISVYITTFVFLVTLGFAMAISILRLNKFYKTVNTVFVLLNHFTISLVFNTVISLIVLFIAESW